jgi:ring-1,2-phenylacetyl-CoA epoxidase subunit PaaD
MVTATATTTAAVTEPLELDVVRRMVEAVPDPELPVLTLGQLGVIRDVRLQPATDATESRVVVNITPTYSGCPAMEVIERDVAETVRRAGHDVEVRLVLAPAWTTDWITEAGRKALQDNGIAPPTAREGTTVRLDLGIRRVGPACPQCGATEVEELARFGSTACKALWRCLSCCEPFDYVKPL